MTLIALLAVAYVVLLAVCVKYAAPLGPDQGDD